MNESRESLLKFYHRHVAIIIELVSYIRHLGLLTSFVRVAFALNQMYI